MINTQHTPQDSTSENSRVEEILRPGPRGALIVAGIATLIVVMLWFSFYYFVFLPRGAVQ